MRRTDEVEVRAEDGDGSAPGEEVLHVGRRRHHARWLWPGAAAVLVLLAAGIAVGRAESRHRTGPAPGSRPTPGSGPAPVGAAGLGPAVDTGKGAVLDIAASGGQLWVLHADRLTGLAGAAGEDRTTPLPPVDLTASTAALRLAVDTTGGRLWVVLEGARQGRAIEYDLPTLTRVRDVRLPALDRAAALSGHLYATSGRQLIDVPPRGAVREVPIPQVVGVGGPIVADPTRARLLMLSRADPTRIWAYRPGRGLTRSTRLPLDNGSIAVTDRTIWVAGFAGHGALLERLDPATLRPVLTGSQYAAFRPGAVLLPGGTHDIWLVSGGIHPSLGCVDDRDGTTRRFWRLAPQSVAAGNHTVVVLNGTRVIALLLGGGCTG